MGPVKRINIQTIPMFIGVLNLYHELLEKDKVFIRPKALNLFLVFYLKLYLNFLE